MTTARKYVLEGVEIAVEPPQGGLYVVSTPIGNLADVTLRALETLAGADIVACEDTRITSRLMQRYGISTKLVAYHEHNAAKQRPHLLRALADGKAVALASDAGTPLVSDPGYRLVVEAIAAGHTVTPIPGASAMLAGLVAAGLPSDRFMFAGFLPPKSAARRKRLEELAGVSATLIFYEAPQRVAAALADMKETLGDRPAAVARELTKKFETFRRDGLSALAAAYANEESPKGEVTILVGPPPDALPGETDIDDLLRARMKSTSLAEAVAEVTAATGASRRTVYARALALKDNADGKD